MRLSGQARYAVKVGLAMATVYGIGLSQAWMNPQWAGFTIAFCALPGQGQSLLKGLDRLAGTAVGCAFALLVMALFPQDRWYFLLVMTIYIGVVTYLMTGSRHAYLWNVAGFVAPLILLAGVSSSEHAFETAVFRGVETSMGIIVWTLISVFIWPQSNAAFLKSTHVGLIASQREMLGALDPTEAGDSDFDKTRATAAGAIQQLAVAMHQGGAERCEVRRQEDTWNRYLTLSRQYSQLLESWYDTACERDNLELDRALPGLAAFTAGLQQRFEGMDSLRAGGDAESAGELALKADEAYLEQLPLADRAVFEVALRQLGRLEETTRELLACVAALCEEEAESGQRDRLPVATPAAPVLDPDRLRYAIMLICCFASAFLLWIFVNPPGHMGLTFLVCGLGLAVVLQPQWNPFTLIPLLLLWLTIATLCFIFVMPALSSYWQLSILIFGYIFCVAYFIKGLANLAGLVAFLNMMPIENHQVYSFATQANNIVYTMIGVLIVAACSLIARSPRPEQALLSMLDRYFRSLSFVLSAAPGAEKNGGRNTRRWRFHRQQLALLPARVGSWSSVIDYSRLPQDNAEQIHALGPSLEALSGRINELLEAWGEPQSKSLLAALSHDLDEWTDHFGYYCEILSSSRAEVKVSDMRRTLEQRLDRLDEKFRAHLLQEGTEEDMALSANLYALLGAFRGVSEAGIAHSALVEAIDWTLIRQEKFPTL